MIRLTVRSQTPEEAVLEVHGWVSGKNAGLLEEEGTRLLGEAGRLVLDLSCRRIGAGYRVMTDRWQRTTDVLVAADGLGRLARYCSEFLVHAVDMEGLQQGVDEQLVALLARHSPLPTTYAGGVHSSADVRTVQQLGDGRVDVTVGSALDIFGGSGLRYRDLVALDRAERQSQGPAHAANAGA